MKIHSFSTSARATLGSLLIILGVALALGAVFLPQARSANPATGLVTTASAPLGFDGTATGTGSANGEATCQEGVNCDTFTLTVGGTGADWTTASKRIEVRITPPLPADDFDLVIHKTDNNGTIIDTSGNSAGTPEVGHINPGTDGVGTYTVHVIYFTTVPGSQYHGTISVVPLTPAPPPVAPLDNGPKIGYENFEAPGVLTNVTTANGPTVEYLGHSAGEPSVGINFNSAAPNNTFGVTNYQSDLETLFISFSNSCANGGPTATWANRPAPTSQVIDSDPIGFTDRMTGRCFAAELTATSPTCKISYSDDDGVTWIPTPGPLASGIDHQTIAGGPYHTPLIGAYPSAYYYCSQDLVAAFCLRSDNGGASWGPPVQTYTTECGGLHGHVKVAPDGTVYLPNKDCGGQSSVVVSENNGITWSIRKVRNDSVETATSASDPAVGIDAANRVYFATADNDSVAVVGVSTDHGSTWTNLYDLSTALGLKNIRYPAVVGGDAGRAAVAFLGSTTTGSADAGTFNGVWHLYVAHTFDGGQSWTTSDATPNDPMQRGCIWTGGGANICRNLLDFYDIAIDKQGRVQVGYADGCPGGDCSQAAPSATGNGYAATAVIARQSSGRRLLAAFDPALPTSAPGMPFVTTRRLGAATYLAWSEADTGNSPITSYQILRGTTSGGESLLTTVPGTQVTYTDSTATDTSKTYYYKVVAVNAVGASCANNEAVAAYRGTTCTGLVIHQNDPSHPESSTAQTMPQLAIDYVAVGEPSASTLMFKIKVTNLNTIPPNSRWRMVWDSFSSPGQQYYVGMRSDSSSTVSYDYGTIATAVVGLVVGVPQETRVGPAAGTYSADGTITLVIPKSGVGNPVAGDLLGAMNGRTFAGDTPATQDFERSTTLVDHTFVKSQTDNSSPASTYMVQGNPVCGSNLAPVGVVSRKTHGTRGDFDIPLPLTGTRGVECRVAGANNSFQVVVSFVAPVTFTSVSSSVGNATAMSSGNNVIISLTNIPNASNPNITLTAVTDGTSTANLTIPMSVLLGDTNASRGTNGTDVSQVKTNSGQNTSGANFRTDVNISGQVNGTDVSLVKTQSGTNLPNAPAAKGVEARKTR